MRILKPFGQIWNYNTIHPWLLLPKWLPLVQWKDRINRMRIISLFSGAGGLDQGLVLANNTIVWANDIDKDAVATYQKEHRIWHGVETLMILIFQRFLMRMWLWEDSTCQGFSVANMRRSDDGRNQLYKSFLRMVVEKPWEVFHSRECRGILNLGKGAVISAIVTDFEKAGYQRYCQSRWIWLISDARRARKLIILDRVRDLKRNEGLAIPPKTNSTSLDERYGMGFDKRKPLVIPGRIVQWHSNTFILYVQGVIREFTRDTDIPIWANLSYNPCQRNGKWSLSCNGETAFDDPKESASIQTFPKKILSLLGKMNSCYRRDLAMQFLSGCQNVGEELQIIGKQMKVCIFVQRCH